MFDRLLPHAAALGGVDPEALELGPGGGTTRAEIDASLRDEIEDGGGLGGADGMVVGLGHKAHAVTEPDVLGARGNSAVEHLGVRAVRILLQEVVLDGPERVPTMSIAGDRLLECVLVSDEFAVGLPGARDRDLVEQRELHDVGSPRFGRPRPARATTVPCSLSVRLTGVQPAGRPVPARWATPGSWIGRTLRCPPAVGIGAAAARNDGQFSLSTTVYLEKGALLPCRGIR
jgi:hypothetical protein